MKTKLENKIEQMDPSSLNRGWDFEDRGEEAIGSRFMFIKRPDPNNQYDITTVNVSFQADSLEDILQSFKDFLVSAGFPWVEEVYVNKDKSE